MTTSAPRKRRGRLWLLLAVAAGVLVALRLALPYAVERVLESQADRFVGGRVAIGDVDLRLLAGGIALTDVIACQDEAARDGAEPAPCTRDHPARWLAVQRFALEIDWLPLLDRELRVTELRIVSPVATAVRTAQGAFALPFELPPDDSPAEEGQGWRVVLHEGVVEGGWLHLRDRLVDPDSRISLELERVDVRRVSLDPAAFEKPAHLQLDASVAGAPIGLEAWFEVGADDAVTVRANIDATGVPLGRVSAHVPELGGFAEIAGAVDLALVYERELGERERVTGAAALRDLRLLVPAEQGPALVWDELAVVLDAVDLRAREAAIRSVRLAGATLPVRVRREPGMQLVGEATEPLLAGRLADVGAGPVDAAVEAAPWSWSVGSLQIEDSELVVAAPEAEPLTIDVAAEAESLVPEGRFPVSVVLRAAGGRVEAAGRAAIDPPSAALDLTIEALPLAALSGALVAPGPVALESGAASGSLAIALEDPQVALTIDGTLTLADLRIEARANPDGFWIASERIEAAFDALRVPLGAAAEPIEARLSRLAFVAPELRILRNEQGFVLRGAAGASAPDAADAGGDGEPAAETAAGAEPADEPEAEADAEPAAEPEAAPDGEPAAETTADPDAATDDEPAADAAATADAAPDAAPVARVQIGSLVVEGGVVHFEDRMVEPFYRQDLTSIEFALSQVSWPDLRIEEIDASIEGVGTEPTTITGFVGPQGAELEVDAHRVKLQPLNPYVTNYSDYAIREGTLTLEVDADLEAGDYAADLDLRLHDLALRGADGEFEQDFGVPLQLGLSLLRDLRGDIALSVPIQVDTEGTRVGIFQAIARSLRRAVFNALLSPLKLLGAVVQRGGEITSFEPEPIAFEPGAAVPTASGDERLAQLASLLASRPGLRVSLRPVVVSADTAQEPSEQPAQPEDGESDGFGAWVSGLFGAGDEEQAAPEDEQPAVAPDALGTARVQAVMARLTEEYGVPADRLVAGPEARTATSGPPRVEIEIETSGGAPAASRSGAPPATLCASSSCSANERTPRSFGMHLASYSPMIRFMDSTDERHVGILVDGKVTEEDMQAIVGLLEESIRKHDQIRVLLQIESLAGVEPKAFLEDLKFSIAHVRDLERAALVGDQGWLAPYARVANAIFPCKVERFATRDLDEAWRWLRA